MSGLLAREKALHLNLLFSQGGKPEFLKSVIMWHAAAACVVQGPKLNATAATTATAAATAP